MRTILLFLSLLPSAFAQGTVTINGSDYSYVAHPRVMLDGPSGTITTSLKDPDGAGPLVAPKANMSNPPYVAMIGRIRPLVATYPPAINSLSVDADAGAYNTFFAALDWFMDNSQTNSLNAAIYWLNNAEKLNSPYQYTCDMTSLSSTSGCGGVGSWTDWPGANAIWVAQAYSLVRSQMSPSERDTFAHKVLNDIDDSCTNQLALLPGVVASSSTSSKTVTGSGFSGAGLVIGDQIYVKAVNSLSSGGYGTIAAINSDTSITLVANATVNVTGGVLWKTQTWADGMCGFAWMMKHHQYSPPNTIGRRVRSTFSASINTSQTNIPVTSASAVFGHLTPPFYVASNTGEMMLVSAVNSTSLDVTRAQLNTVAAARSAGGDVTYWAYPQSGSSSSEYAHNIIIQHIYAYIALAIATLDDLPTQAGVLLDESGTAWLRDIAPLNQAMWTGLTQSGSSTYTGRQAGIGSTIVGMLKSSLGHDTSGGNWIKNFAYYTLYFSLPGTPINVVPWGQDDIAETVVSYQSRTHIPNIIGLYPSSDEAKYADYWQRNYASQYTSAVMQSGSGYRITALNLIQSPISTIGVDWRSVLPTQRAFNTVDSETKRPVAAWISRTGWNSATDSLVIASAYDINYTTDHMGTGNPASYKIWKNGWSLDENGSSSDKDTGVGTNSNMIVFGGAANLKSTSTFQDVDLIAAGDSTVASKWAYTRINAVNAYTATAAATRALRHIVHFKKPSTQDYVVVYDDVASSAGKTKAIGLHYDKTSGEASTMTTQALPDLVWTGPNRRISSKVLLPATAVLTSTSPTNSYKQVICASADSSTCDATNTSAEFLVVHRPSTSTSDTMPTVSLLTSDADHRAVQVAGADPKVAIFPRAGGTFSDVTFVSTHSGTAQYCMAGLAEGAYNISSPASLLGQIVDSVGVLCWEATAGSYTISQAPIIPVPPTITTESLPAGVLSTPYAYTIPATGDTPITWSVVSGSLPTWASLDTSTGTITGTPDAVATSSFTVRATNGAGTDDKALTITIPAPTVTGYGGTWSGKIGQ